METEAELAARTSIEGIVSDPSCSFWLKAALEWAIERDVVDAANHAEVPSSAASRPLRRGAGEARWRSTRLLVTGGFISGWSLGPYVGAWDIDLSLSNEPDDAPAGAAAARLEPSPGGAPPTRSASPSTATP